MCECVCARSVCGVAHEDMAYTRRRQRVACRPVSGVAAAATRSGRACHHVHRPRNACIRARARACIGIFTSSRSAIHLYAAADAYTSSSSSSSSSRLPRDSYIYIIIVRHDSAGNLRVHHNDIIYNNVIPQSYYIILCIYNIYHRKRCCRLHDI